MPNRVGKKQRDCDERTRTPARKKPRAKRGKPTKTTQSQSQAAATIAETARTLEISEDTVRRDLRRGAPVRLDGPKSAGTRIDVAKYQQWRLAQGLGGERGRPKDQSENLERFRAARADREEMRRDRERGTHVKLEELDGLIAALAGMLRGGIEALQRRFGAEIVTATNELLDEFVASWDQGRPGRRKTTR